MEEAQDSVKMLACISRVEMDDYITAGWAIVVKSVIKLAIDFKCFKVGMCSIFFIKVRVSTR